MLHVKSDNTVDFPAIYPAFYGVIDVDDPVIPGHSFTFLSADWGGGNLLFQIEDRL